MDFVNETWNGWVLHFTQRSACWTVPGETAIRIMVGWNIEIMFSIAGIIYYHTLSEDPAERLPGIPNRWLWAIVYSAFCVFVEYGLNAGGLLVWEYPWWNRVLSVKSNKARIALIACLYVGAIIANGYVWDIWGGVIRKPPPHALGAVIGTCEGLANLGDAFLPAPY